jgi:hypothetical protein
MLQYVFTDYLDLSASEHYALAQILDQHTETNDYEEEYDYFSLSTEA